MLLLCGNFPNIYIVENTQMLNLVRDPHQKVLISLFAEKFDLNEWRQNCTMVLYGVTLNPIGAKVHQRYLLFWKERKFTWRPMHCSMRVHGVCVYVPGIVFILLYYYYIIIIIYMYMGLLIYLWIWNGWKLSILCNVHIRDTLVWHNIQDPKFLGLPSN